MPISLADQARLEAVEKTTKEYAECLDTIWMLLATMLVFFMHAGFSLLESGSVRFKNTQNILAKNLVVVTVGFLCWYVFGYAFAFGIPEKSPNEFIGHTNFFMDGLWQTKETFRFWLFQGAFCATAATIVSGAMAERTQLKGFSIFTVLMTSFIYPVVIYWGWSGAGMLYNDDGSVVGPAVQDFAGSGLVHLVGGVAALVGAIVVGPRKDRWDESSATDFECHSVPFCVLGTFFLWFGWYGFNAGSTGSMSDEATANLAGLVAVNTTLAPCVAGLLVFFLRAMVLPPKLLDVSGFANGILAGLVSITAGCAFVETYEALIIGFIGGFVYAGTSMLVKKLKIDDVVDAFAVHGACGLWGLLAPGFFGGEDDIGGNGVFYGGDQLGIQIFAALMIILWVGILSLLIFFPLKMAGMLRLSDDFQDKGADAMEHCPPRAYADNGKLGEI